jgi:hypothetical protein
VTPDELIAAYQHASELGTQAATDAQRYADARCVALYALAAEHDESLSTISARVGLTRARVQQMTARGRTVVSDKPFVYDPDGHGLLPLAEGKTREQVTT